MQEKVEEAIACFRRALELQPDYVKALSNLGLILSRTGKLDEAKAHLQQAVAINPDHAEAHNNLGNIFLEQGLLKEAVHCYKRALMCRPDFAGAHSNLLVCRNYDPDAGPEALELEHRRWAIQHAPADPHPSHKNTRDPDARCASGIFRPTSAGTPSRTSSSRS